MKEREREGREQRKSENRKKTVESSERTVQTYSVTRN